MLFLAAFAVLTLAALALVVIGTGFAAALVMAATSHMGTSGHSAQRQRNHNRQPTHRRLRVRKNAP